MFNGANDANLLEIYTKTKNDSFIEKAKSTEHKIGPLQNANGEKLERETQKLNETFVAHTPFGFDVNDLVKNSPADLAKSLKIDQLGKMKMKL